MAVISAFKIKWHRTTGWVFILYLLLAIFIYWPILFNGFLSDDYDSLYRILIEKQVIIKGFLRPMIDWTFYLNYRISGLNAWSYYWFNLLLHIANAYLVYKLVNSWGNSGSGIKGEARVAFFSGLLFLVYPFHNEGIVWLTGRLAAIACFFALAGMNIMFTNWPVLAKRILFVVCYFAGLLAYESILFLPFIAIILLWQKGKTAIIVLGEVAAAAAMLVLYILLRYFVSGVVYGDYGERMTMKNSWSKPMEKLFKTMGRTVLPPLENSTLWSTLLMLVCIIVAGLFFFRWKNRGQRFGSDRELRKIGISFLIAMCIPVLFGISTRTSEGDRLLYFPSVFLVILVAYCVMQITNPRLRRGLALMLCLSAICALSINNAKWNKASRISAEILEKIKHSKKKDVVIINLPDELEGVGIFRNGFYKALVLNGVDSQRVRVNNVLTRLEYLRLADPIDIDTLRASRFIAPAALLTVENQGVSVRVFNPVTSNIIDANLDDNVLYFWNRQELKQVF